MSDAPILPDDNPPSMPSMPTQWGGDPACLGRIDHYDLLRKLGGGGFGVVYLARDSVSGVEVAIKTLHPLLKHNAEEMDLLREKFRLVSRLSHPNIATALVLHPCREINLFDDVARAELKLSPGDSVIVMRYAPGVTLSKWRRQFPDGIVPFDLALEIGRQVAAALDYAHSERIVHRDVKPSNVMVETVAAEPRPLDHGQGAARSLIAPTLRVRILDFGLAAEIRSSMSRVSTESGDTSGTRPYMAPEQWLGKKQDGRTDQYALACVLYELLSGAPPFAGVFETGDPVVMMNAVENRTPASIDSLDASCNAVLAKALSKKPADRYATCMDLVDGLKSGEADSGFGGRNKAGVRASLSPAHMSSAAESGDAAEVFLVTLQEKPLSLLHKDVVGRWFLRCCKVGWWLPSGEVPRLNDFIDVFYLSRSVQIFSWSFFGAGALLSFLTIFFLIDDELTDWFTFSLSPFLVCCVLLGFVWSLAFFVRSLRLVRSGFFARDAEVSCAFQRSRGILLVLFYAVLWSFASPRADWTSSDVPPLFLLFVPLSFRFIVAKTLWRTPQSPFRLLAKIALSQAFLLLLIFSMFSISSKTIRWILQFLFLCEVPVECWLTRGISKKVFLSVCISAAVVIAIRENL